MGGNSLLRLESLAHDRDLFGGFVHGEGAVEVFLELEGEGVSVGGFSEVEVVLRNYLLLIILVFIIAAHHVGLTLVTFIHSRWSSSYMYRFLFRHNIPIFVFLTTQWTIIGVHLGACWKRRLNTHVVLPVARALIYQRLSVIRQFFAHFRQDSELFGDFLSNFFLRAKGCFESLFLFRFASPVKTSHLDVEALLFLGVIHFRITRLETALEDRVVCVGSKG